MLDLKFASDFQTAKDAGLFFQPGSGDFSSLSSRFANTFACVVEQVTPGERQPITDQVSIEEPLEIQVDGQPVAVLMRTPGHEKELAVGFVISEGLLPNMDAIALVQHCGRLGLNEQAGDDLDPSRNVVRITTLDKLKTDPRLDIVRLVRSGCGRADAQLLAATLPPVESSLQVSAAVLHQLGLAIRSGQELYHQAGGIHAAGVFTAQGQAIVILEDIGRHNAVDKVLGYCLLRHIPLQDKLLVSTGRASYEMLTKAVRLGIPVIASLSSPTSLTVELARALNCTLVGYLRPRRLLIYSHGWRVVP